MSQEGYVRKCYTCDARTMEDCDCPRARPAPKPEAPLGLTAQEWAAKCAAETYKPCGKCNGRGMRGIDRPGYTPGLYACPQCRGSGRVKA